MTNKAPFCTSLRLIRTLLGQLLNKAILMALWMKAIICEKAGFKSRFCQVHQAGKIGVNQRNPRLIKDLRLRKFTYEKIKLFLQNEPNFQKVKSNVTTFITMNYDQMDTWSIRKNEPKTNPNEPNLSCRSLRRSRNKPNLKATK